MYLVVNRVRAAQWSCSRPISFTIRSEKLLIHVSANEGENRLSCPGFTFLQHLLLRWSFQA